MMGRNEKNMNQLTTTFARAIVAFVTISLLAGCGEKTTSINIDLGDLECGVDCNDVNGDGVCDDGEYAGDPCSGSGNGGDGDADGDVDREVCNNGRDDDGDGRVDCNDSDCSGSPVCDSSCDDDPDCNDRDGDTWPTPQDCNDNDPNTYPGAPEVCDGQDNDCDGTIDEGGCCGGDDLPQCSYSDMQCPEWPEPDGSLVQFGYAPGGEDSAVLLSNGCYLFPASNCADFRAQYGGSNQNLQLAIHSAFNIDPSLTAVSCAEVCW